MKRETPPSIPSPLSALQPISLDVLREKYLKPGETGVEDLYRRVARALASVEAPDLREKYEALFLANLHAGAIHDTQIALDQRVHLIGQRLDFPRKIAFQTLRLAIAHLAKGGTGAVERLQTIENGKAVEQKAAKTGNKAAAAEAMCVTTKALAARPFAARALPALKPNHPNHRIKTPKEASGIL